VANAMTDVLILQGLAFVLGITGNIMVNYRRIQGFYFWIASNVALITVSAINGLYLMSMLFLIYIGLCVHGIQRWRKAP